MARRQEYDSHRNSGTRCGYCGEDMPREYWSNPSEPPPPVHCAGSRVAYRTPGIPDPHHGRIQHPNCWRCGESMGCDQCAGKPRDALCRRCACWVYPVGLAMNGPIINAAPAVHRRGGIRAPQVDEYPAEFQRAYARANRREANFGESNARLKALLASVSKPVAKPDMEADGLFQETDEQVRAADRRRQALHEQSALIE